MKILSTLAFVLCLGATALAQKTEENRIPKSQFKVTASPTVKSITRSEAPEQPARNVITGVKATVQVSTECGAFVEVTQNDVTKKYYVINLTNEFREHGKVIVFDYYEDEVRFPMDCGFDRAIQVNNVKAVK